MLILSGCAGAGSEKPVPAVPSEPSETSAPKVFTGTPDEYSEAHRTCIERAGFTVNPAPEGSGGAFEIDMSGHTDAEFGEAAERCGDEIGSPDMTALTEEQLRASYDMRVNIQRCLVDNGWSAEQPMAWETFRDQWYAGSVPWEPLSEATRDMTVSEGNQAQRTCDLQDGLTW